VARVSALGARTTRRLTAGLAAFGVLWALAGCADPARKEASVFEGTVSLRLRDDRGQVMAQGYATAGEGTPGRGEFSAALTFTPPAASHPWTVEAFEVSAEDGRILYLVKLPVWVGR
jgi:hypothetical protein